MAYLRYLNGPLAWLFTLRFKPSAFRRDPELWLANQAGHFSLGVWASIALCGLWYFFAEELPRRDAIGVIIAVIYMWYELGSQKWRGWDTVEDWLFVAVYGSGGALYCFREVEIGSDRIYASLYDILLASVPPLTHLFVGVFVRAKRRLRTERQKT